MVCNLHKKTTGAFDGIIESLLKRCEHLLHHMTINLRATREGLQGNRMLAVVAINFAALM